MEKNNAGEEVQNKQVIFKDYVSGYPKESDLYIKTRTIKLQVPQGSNGILVKNMNLSCDPTMQFQMRKPQERLSGYYYYLPGSVDLLINKLGFDDAFNYKEEPDLDAALKRCITDGIDLYFEQVGGKILDAVLLNMKVHGRIVVCGMISQYNLSELEPLNNIMQIAFKRLSIKGFTHRDHHHLYPKLLETVLPYIR